MNKISFEKYIELQVIAMVHNSNLNIKEAKCLVDNVLGFNDSSNDEPVVRDCSNCEFGDFHGDSVPCNTCGIPDYRNWKKEQK